MPRGRRRATLTRSPILRATMWDKKVDGQTYAAQLAASKPLALPRVAEYQVEHEHLISIVKGILEKFALTPQTHEYMWYASKLYGLLRKYSGQALKKEVDAVFLYYLAKGMDEMALRLIARALGIKVSTIEDISEKVLSPILLRVITSGTLIADGTEQTLLEYTGNVAMISGYIDLSNMRFGDEVSISIYVKLRPDGEYRLYRKEEFIGAQEEPAIYMLPRLSGVGIKVTLQQTSGTYRGFDYYFAKGV